MEKMSQKSIAMPEKDWNQLGEWAKTCELSISEIVRRMIKQHDDSITSKTAKAIDDYMKDKPELSNDAVARMKNIKLSRIIDDELANDILKAVTGTGLDVTEWICNAIIDARNDYYLSKLDEKIEEMAANGTLGVKHYYNVMFVDGWDKTFRADYMRESNDGKFIEFCLDIDDKNANQVASVQSSLIKFITSEYK